MTTPRPPLSWQALAGAAGLALALGAYAVLGHIAASRPHPGLLEAAFFIVPVVVFAGIVAWRSAHRRAWMALWLAACVVLVLLRDQLGASTAWALLLQHVGLNGMLCLGFGRTLAPGREPLVSHMAGFVHGFPLSPRLAAYTRKVTLAWAIYFAFTSLVSLVLFALAPTEVWSAYVNLLSFPMLAVMFGAEYLVRITVIPRAERSGFFEGVAAYRRYSRSGQDKP